MLLKWEMLFADIIHIFICYLVLAFGKQIGTVNPGFRVYLWRGKEYLI